MTKQQKVRLIRKFWERMTRGDGYQPFGYDMRTLKLTKPLWVADGRRLQRWIDNN